MSEHNEQVGLFQWVDQIGTKKYPQLIDLHAIPNGGHRNPSVAVKLKAEGVRSGVWDLFLPAPAHSGKTTYHGLYIELKYGNNRLSPAQSAFGERMWNSGYYCSVCFCWEEAVDVLNNYLARTWCLPDFEVDRYSQKNWRYKLECVS